jgi:hypothetical protein
MRNTGRSWSRRGSLLLGVTLGLHGRCWYACVHPAARPQRLPTGHPGGFGGAGGNARLIGDGGNGGNGGFGVPPGAPGIGGAGGLLLGLDGMTGLP